MAELGSIELKLGSLKDEGLKGVLLSIFRTLVKDVRFGRAVDGDPSQNFGGGFFVGTTHAVANTEFSIVHTLGRIPYLIVPVLPLSVVNAKIPRLTVTKAADANRVYLSSPDTSAAFYIYLEG